MAKPFQFAFLLDRAITARDDAGRTLQLAEGRLRQGRDKLQEVEQFRDEYRQRLCGGNRSYSVALYLDYQRFLVRIDSAIAVQQQEIARLQQVYQRSVLHWQECDRQVNAYELLQQRHRQHEAAREAKLEQKLSDEWASRSLRKEE